MSASAPAASPPWPNTSTAVRCSTPPGCWCCPAGSTAIAISSSLQQGGGADEETFTTGSRAALAGGTTSVVTLLNTVQGRRRAGAAGGVSPPGRGGGCGGLRVSPDHYRSDGRRHRGRVAADRGRRRAQPQGVPDLRSAASGTTANTWPCSPPRAGSAAWSRCIARITTPSPGAPPPCSPMAGPRRNTTPGPRPSVVEREGDAPRHRLGRTGRHPDRGLPRLLHGGRRGNRPRPGARREGLGRDLPAILRAHRRRHGPARLRRREVHVQPGPTRPRGRRRIVAGDPAAHAHHRQLRPQRLEL